MAFRGKGARQWKKVCFHDWQGQLPVCCADGVAKVHLVGAYNHLGGTLQYWPKVDP